MGSQEGRNPDGGTGHFGQKKGGDLLKKKSFPEKRKRLKKMKKTSAERGTREMDENGKWVRIKWKRRRKQRKRGGGGKGEGMGGGGGN